MDRELKRDLDKNKIILTNVRLQIQLVLKSVKVKSLKSFTGILIEKITDV